VIAKNRPKEKFISLQNIEALSKDIHIKNANNKISYRQSNTSIIKRQILLLKIELFNILQQKALRLTICKLRKFKKSVKVITK